MEIDGAHVLVTGASRGIGAGLARAFATAGGRVTVVARTATAVEELAAETGGTALVADLADAAGRAGLIARVEEAAGPVDVLVNNAGIDVTGTLDDMDPADLERLVAINVLAPMELTRQVLPGMIDRGRGHVVNMSSLAGTAVLPGMVAYAASKSALTHFTAGLRADLRGLPVGTTVVEVGLVPTDMRASVVAHPPTAAAFRRFYRLGLLTDTPLDRLCAHTVRAVADDRRHVRLPRRAWAFAALAEAPRRITELTITGVRAR
ncbi:SDR family oxidoreductase [Miltoncostaea oceani]|uniref:SDR family oxidoreductase n=1 Tax=Miltoncostaea oceani TaxID=2843216 RepID=UPI001C3C8876|nr:SDR family NAD(P)-dependent oxidoreductase [Miltoncostaea oceani]